MLDLQCSESEFKSEIRKFAKKHGWRVYFSKRSDDKGWPDLVLVRDGQLIFAELKRETGYKIYPEQEEWLEDLSEVESVEAHMWFPHDFESIKLRLT